MTNKDKQEGIIKKINPFLFQRQEILMAYLYGSYAKGTPHGHSDIDVAIYLKHRVDDNKHPYGYRAELITSLIKLLGTNKIDLIILIDVPPFLKFQVVRYGTLIFTRSEAKRIEFHAGTIAKYLDVKYLLAIQYEFMSKRLADGTYGKR
ncbi:MAG: nucleotidyltransferase domain-containing protein [Nitrospira sp.]|nr:nucleotidyltransferase domain-containing protein [Nitrospira sp.]